LFSATAPLGGAGSGEGPRYLQDDCAGATPEAVGLVSGPQQISNPYAAFHEHCVNTEELPGVVVSCPVLARLIKVRLFSVPGISHA